MKPCAWYQSAARSCQLVHPFRFGLQKLVFEQFAEQGVITIPGALFVQGHQEEVVAFQVLQGFAARRLAGHGFAEGGGKLVEDRCAAQKRAHLFRLAGQHFLDQIVQDVAVRAPEPLHETGRVVAFLQRQGRQLQAGRPALRAPRRVSICLWGRVTPITLEKKALASSREKLRSAARISVSWLRTRSRVRGRSGIFPRGDDQVQPGDALAEQRLEEAVDLLIFDQVILFQHQDDRPLQAVQIVDQQPKRLLNMHLLRAFHHLQGLLPQMIPGLVQGGQEIGEELAQIVVGFLQRDPGHGAFRLLHPHANGRRLAIAGQGPRTG